MIPALSSIASTGNAACRRFRVGQFAGSLGGEVDAFRDYVAAGGRLYATGYTPMDVEPVEPGSSMWSLPSAAPGVCHSDCRW
jgi:hypothetical protein